MSHRKESFGQSHKSVLDKLIAYVRISKIKKYIPVGSKILDLGCGYNGELLTDLSSILQSGVGVDLSVNPKYSNEMVKLSTGRVDHKLPFPDKSFDVVSALAIIEHVDDPDMMLHEMLRVLRPGGLVLITTPSLAGKLPLEIMARLGIISDAEISDHKRYYTRQTLADAIKGAGLRSVKVRHFGIMYLNLFGIAKR